MSHVINSISEDKVAKFPEYVNKWVDIGLDTKECNVPEAIKYIKECYAQHSFKEPKFFIGPVNSPYEGALAEKILNEFAENNVKFNDSDHLNELVMSEIEIRINQKNEVSISNQMYGCGEYWLGFYDFWQNEFPEIKGLEIINPLKELAKHIGWWTPLTDIVILQHKPLEIHRDEEGILHNTNGPAIKYRGNSDLCNIYRVHGVAVTKNIIDRNFNANDIENETNVEVRRVMIDLYGEQKFLMETKTEEVHSDDFGTLYRKELEDDEDIYMVKVVNSTPEPDGSFKDYFIRVDPNAYGGLKTAKAAVASTWRNNDGSLVFENPDDYNCFIQT